MKRYATLPVLYAGAALVFLAGTVFTAATVTRMPFHFRRLNDRKTIYLRLLELEEKRSRQQSAVRAFELLENGKPAPLGSLAASHFPDVTPEIRERESIELPNGWTLTLVEITCGDVRLDRIPAFLHAAESGRPPWRLVECHISASRADGGFGRAALTLESLAR